MLILIKGNSRIRLQVLPSLRDVSFSRSRAVCYGYDEIVRDKIETKVLVIEAKVGYKTRRFFHFVKRVAYDACVPGTRYGKYISHLKNYTRDFPRNFRFQGDQWRRVYTVQRTIAELINCCLYLIIYKSAIYLPISNRRK